jgi:Phospholipase_D-nuclease N-terminal
MYGGIIGLIILILDIIAIVKVLGGGGPTTYEVVWILLILCLALLGMVLQFLVGQKDVA